MAADADLQVWLETSSDAGQTTIIPCMKTRQDMRLDFRMSLVQRARSGVSRVIQQGQLNAAAGVPNQLARLSFGREKETQCEVEIALTREGQAPLLYVFDICER